LLKKNKIFIYQMEDKDEEMPEIQTKQINGVEI